MAKQMRLVIAASLLLSCLPAFTQAEDAGPPERRVVVVANKAVPDSLRVAKAYMRFRNIPETHLIEVETAETEKITREVFIAELHNPILSALVDRELVDAFEAADDPFGRKAVTVLSVDVDYVVLCYGVPARITESPPGTLDDSELREAAFTGNLAGLKDQFAEGPLARDEASVDTELTLLLKRGAPMTGFIPNPFFQNQRPGGVQDILKVTRLDGPTPDAVIRMLESIRKGEEQGLKGRAYVDEDGRDGPYQTGNDWLRRTHQYFETLGFGTTHETRRRTIRASERFDAPVLYAGWYDRHVSGPFRLPGFQFPPGAVAVHLHSFSADPIRSDSRSWVGPFVHRGVSATLGNVAEPYLTFTHHFDVFFAALADGWNFGDAAYMSLPALSWQAVAIGDPLYRPFAVPLDTQLKDLGNPLNILSDQYLVIRQIRLLEAQGKTDEALATANRGMREAPGPALGLERARLLEEHGKPKDAIDALAFLSQLQPTDPMEWGLYAEMADTLHRLGDPRSALKIYQNLEKQRMPGAIKKAFLKRGIPVAGDAGRSDLAIEWRARTTPPPKAPAADPAESKEAKP